MVKRYNTPASYPATNKPSEFATVLKQAEEHLAQRGMVLNFEDGGWYLHSSNASNQQFVPPTLSLPGVPGPAYGKPTIDYTPTISKPAPAKPVPTRLEVTKVESFIDLLPVYEGRVFRDNKWVEKKLVYINYQWVDKELAHTVFSSQSPAFTFKDSAIEVNGKQADIKLISDYAQEFKHNPNRYLPIVNGHEASIDEVLNTVAIWAAKHGQVDPLLIALAAGADTSFSDDGTHTANDYAATPQIAYILAHYQEHKLTPDMSLAQLHAIFDSPTGAN